MLSCRVKYRVDAYVRGPTPVADLHSKILDARPPLLGVQILSISCSFWEILAKSYVGAPPGELAPPPGGNPRSATGHPIKESPESATVHAMLKTGNVFFKHKCHTHTFFFAMKSISTIFWFDAARRCDRHEKRCRRWSRWTRIAVTSVGGPRRSAPAPGSSGCPRHRRAVPRASHCTSTPRGYSAARPPLPSPPTRSRSCPRRLPGWRPGWRCWGRWRDAGPGGNTCPCTTVSVRCRGSVRGPWTRRLTSLSFQSPGPQTGRYIQNPTLPWTVDQFHSSETARLAHNPTWTAVPFQSPRPVAVL